MTVGIKATAAESEKRITTIIDLLVDGWSRTAIVQKYSVEWKISDRQVDTYISHANELLKEEATFERKAHISKALRRYELIFRKALAKGDLRRAIEAQNSLDKLLGLNERIKLDITSDDQPLKLLWPTDLSDDDADSDI